MKFFWKKWIFIAQFHFQDPNTDPDPAWQFESGSTQIRNTAYEAEVQIRSRIHYADTDLDPAC